MNLRPPGSLLLATLLWVSTNVLAQEKSSPGRDEFVEPIITEETLPNEPGEWDLRLGCGYDPDLTKNPGDCLQTQVFFGIAQRWGLELESSLLNVAGNRPEDPQAELGAGIKYLLRKPSLRGPALAIALQTEFAVGRPESSEEGRVELQPTFAFLLPVGRMTLQGNVGYSVTPGGAATEHRAVYNLSLAVPSPHEQWHAMAELAGSTGTGAPLLAFSPGVKYRIGRGHFLAVGVPLGLNSSSTAVGAIFQLQISLRSPGEEAGEQ